MAITASSTTTCPRRSTCSSSPPRGRPAGEFRDRVFDRAASFARDYALFFDADGRNIGYGRSRSYKFSASFFFAMCAWAGVPGVDPGLCRVHRVPQYCAGTCAQPLFAADGRARGRIRLHANERVDEVYIGPNSCAWAFQAFLPMALPAEHPFWSAPEPERPRGVQRFLPAPNCVVTVDDIRPRCDAVQRRQPSPVRLRRPRREVRQIRLLQPFRHQRSPMPVSASFDHMICLRLPSGETWSHRHRFEILPGQGDAGSCRATSRSSGDDGHGHHHRAARAGLLVHAHAPVLQLARAYDVREGGTPVLPHAAERDDETPVYRAGDRLDRVCAGPTVMAARLVSARRDDTPGQTDHVNTNLLHRRVWTPVLDGTLAAGTHLIATAWWADVDPLAPVPSPPHDEMIELPHWDGAPLNIIAGGGFPRGSQRIS
jgi:hypothetical protein